jgi:tetratricopeptide (TPR) repeat protein
LQEAGVDRAKLPREYLELLKLLGGHPLSLRVVLRHLKTQTPVQLIEALRRGLDTFQGVQEEGREKSLVVSLDYSFANLSARARQHLPFLGLFSERVNGHWLHAFSANPDDDFGQAYRLVFGENLQKSDWIGLLNEATAAGILEDLGESIYKVHPALPWYLRQQLDKMGSQEVISTLEKKLLVFYAGLADKYRQKLISNAEVASFGLGVEEPNLLQQLRLAEQLQKWAEALEIMAALGEVYLRWGRKSEFKSLRERALNQIGFHLAEAKTKGKDAFNFWSYMRVVDANEAIESADLETARAVYQEIIDEVLVLNDPSLNYHIATNYHNLGRVAEEQRRFDDAIAFYKKSLQIYEDEGDFYSPATVYHNLGILAQKQRRFEDAIAFYNKALQIREDAGDFYSAASDYHHLGMVAQYQRRFDDAIAFYNKALQIREDAGDFYSAATDYHHLGMVAQEQQRFDEAIAFYNKALQIREDAGDFYSAATDYHHLGILAQLQRRFEEAIAFYNKALQIFEDTEDFYTAATVYHQLGMVAQEQRRFDEAIAFYNIALQVFEDTGDFYKAANQYHVLGMVAQEQGRFDDGVAYFQKEFAARSAAKDWRRASLALPRWGSILETQSNWTEAVKIYIQALNIDIDHNSEWVGWDLKNLGRMLKQLGESQFKIIWREFMGDECPEDWFSAIQEASSIDPN